VRVELGLNYRIQALVVHPILTTDALNHEIVFSIIAGLAEAVQALEVVVVRVLRVASFLGRVQVAHLPAHELRVAAIAPEDPIAVLHHIRLIPTNESHS
jgi:hypothetical protein